MSNWNENILQRAFELEETYNLREVTELINEEFNTEFTYDALRKKLLRERDNVQPKEKLDYKETIEIKEDGTHKSDKLLRMNAEKTKDVNYLLEAHGYDKNEWTLTSAKNNIWNTNDKQNGVQTLYSSKITVKPKSDGYDFDKLLQAIESREPKEPIEYQGTRIDEPTYLELPLFDLHFGIADLEYYQQTLQDILHLLQKSYKEVLLIVGQDCLHNDNFKGQTANGTQIDQVDMQKAIDDVELFYETIINEALKNSEKVTVVYNKGNHDESMAYMLARGLRNLYRNNKRITFDVEFKERKAHMLGLNFLGTTHGEKNRANLAANFSVEFPVMWSKATTRECHIGHLHRKKATKKGIDFINDADGLIVREMGTGNKTDGYHDDNGFNLAHKEFEVFEYTETKKKRIHYV